MQAEKRQLWIILLIVFVGFIGTSVAYPLFPPMFIHPVDGSIVPPTWSLSTRSILLGITLAVFPLGQFIGAPILGSCSDRYGRKRVLVWSLLGSVIGYLFTILSLELNWFWGLLISRFFTGLMEGNIAIVRAMVIELRSINKFRSLGSISSASSIGYIIGPLFAGLLSDKCIVSWFSFTFPFLLALIASLMALFLAIFKLVDVNVQKSAEISIKQRFNIIKCFRLLFNSSDNTLKHLLMVSTCFTFALDIFYEFSLVYLTGVWMMTPGMLAIYNALLCITLAIGNGWLSHYLSNFYSVTQITIAGMVITGIIFALMTIFHQPLFVFLLFGLVGLSIGIAFTSLTVQISNSAHQSIQSEAMGTQHGLRVLGDAVICFVGGFLIVKSVLLPIALSCMITLIVAGIYARKFLGPSFTKI